MLCATGLPETGDPGRAVLAPLLRPNPLPAALTVASACGKDAQAAHSIPGCVGNGKKTRPRGPGWGSRHPLRLELLDLSGLSEAMTDAACPHN